MLNVADLATDAAQAALFTDLELDLAGQPGRPVVVIDADSAAGLSQTTLTCAADRMRTAQCVVLAIATTRPAPAALAAAADLTLAPRSLETAGVVGVDEVATELDHLLRRIGQAPRAAIALAWLLRAGERLTVKQGLGAESAAYSTLLAGSEFARWLADRGPTRPPDGPERVLLARDGNTLHLTLSRPRRRNAVDAAMRHALGEALDLARLDGELRVVIDAQGPSFSAGGDLDEFGTATDQAAAHLIRVAASVGARLHELADRVEVRVHGACLGAGIELPAFAGRIVARPDAYFGLPELDLGLIPGAGGTVSITRRIGRARTAWLALSGRHLDAETALRWGLIDEIN